MIFFIEIVNILKKTKNNPSQPRITAMESKLDPRSTCIKSFITSKKNFTIH